MDTEQFRRRQYAHFVNDDRTPVAALCHKLVIPEALHEHHPRTCDVHWIPASSRRLARKPVTRHRWDHDVKGIFCLTAVGCRVSERTDDIDHLDDGAGPAVGDDQGQCVVVARFDVDEVNVETIDLGYELGKAVQPCLDPSEVVVACPVAGERLHRRQLHTLRVVFDGLSRASVSPRSAAAGR